MHNAEWQVRLLDTEGTDCVWRDRAVTATGRGTLAEAAVATRGGRVTLVIPGSAVLLTRVAVPADQRGKARAAIPWAIEDRLAEEVEALHFALGERGADGTWPVAVVARRFLDASLQACAEAGLEPDAVTPAQLALPVPGDGEWVTREEFGQVTVRTGADSGFACEPAMLDVVTTAMDPPVRLRRHGTVAADWPASIPAGESVLEPEPDAGDGINLLQGDYARTGDAATHLRRWRIPAAVGIAAAVAAAAHIGLNYQALVEREHALRASMQSIYGQAFPDAGEVADPRARMAAQLREREQSARSTGDTLTGRLARVGSAINDTGNARLAGLQWRSGTLDITVRSPDIPALDDVQLAIEKSGLSVSVQDVERADGAIEGHLRIREAS